MVTLNGHGGETGRSGHVGEHPPAGGLVAGKGGEDALRHRRLEPSMSHRYSYDCVITKEEDGYIVSFPQLPGCFTDGDTREEAVTNAAEVLQTFMADYVENGETPPMYERAAEIVNISVEVTDADLDEMRYMTQADAADLLGVSASRITALIKSGRLDAKWFDGRRKVSIASVRAYASSPRESGRPLVLAV